MVFRPSAATLATANDLHDVNDRARGSGGSGSQTAVLVRESVDVYAQTTVMVTHEQRTAAIADRILVLDDALIAPELGKSDQQRVLTVMEELGR